jgi:glycosyltransferase involved in cell wall biosynthesis
LNISVVIPTYNEESYITETLTHLSKTKSAAISKGIESETIVVDSGHDETLRLAKPIADKSLHFRERGVSKARNYGASRATGEILLFMDADVVVPSDLFEKVAEAFKDEATVAAISRVRPRRSASNNLSVSKSLFYLFDDIFITSCIRHKSLLRFYNRGDILAIRQRSFRRAGGFNEELAIMEITELVLKLSQQGKIALLNTTVYESVRRLKQWGVLKSYLIWGKYYISYWLARRSLSSNYEPVR